MKRFLFVVPPLFGHINPTISVAAELEKLGHEVAWAAHPNATAKILPSGAKVFALDEQVISDAAFKDATERSKSLRGLAAFKFLWEEFFLPLARAMRPGVDAAVAAFEPDVLIVDQQALAGGLVARRRNLPWATFSTTSAAVVDPLRTSLPKVQEWLEEHLATMQREAELPVVPDCDRSPHLVVVFSTEALVGPHGFAPHYRFVGPSISQRVETTPFPFDALDRSVPRVLVSLGTVNAEIGEPFYRTFLEAARHIRAQFVLSAPPELAQDPPPNVMVHRFVPQLSLLPHMSAVVCHAGHNTTCEALANGLPLVVLPIKDDQPVVAQQVADAGAGIRLKFGRVKSPELQAAIERVLNEPSYRAAATKIRDSFAAAGGAARAAQELAGLA